MDPVEQVIAHVCLHHRDTDNSSRPIFLFLSSEIGTSKNGVKRTSNSSTSALHSQVSTNVNNVVSFFFFLRLIRSYSSVGFSCLRCGSCCVRLIAVDAV